MILNISQAGACATSLLQAAFAANLAGVLAFGAERGGTKLPKLFAE